MYSQSERQLGSYLKVNTKKNFFNTNVMHFLKDDNTWKKAQLMRLYLIKFICITKDNKRKVKIQMTDL